MTIDVGDEPDLAPIEVELEAAEVAGFDAFFRSEYRSLVTLAAALTGSRAVAEELAQEAMLRAHGRWSRVAAYDRPGAWVRRVTINLATNARARRRSEARALERLGHQRAHEAAGPDDGFWVLVRQLPGRQAAAVALHYLEDRPVAEVAAVMGCAEGTAKAHLHKGRAALARLLHEEDRP